MVHTDVEGDPFAGTQELEELLSLVAERLINTQVLSVDS
jgi:hypothetical protein